MRHFIPILIVTILLSACAGGESAKPTTTLAPTVPPTSAPLIQPTEPSAQPTELPATVTDTPALPTSTRPEGEPTRPTGEPTNQPTNQPTRSTDEPTNTPPPVAEGRISFRDNLAVADQLSLTLRGVAPPPVGFVYEGWLIADDDVTEISAGVFEVGAGGSVDYVWTSPTGDNLIAEYAGFAVTVEPTDDSDPGPSDQVAFKGAADPATLVAARRVFAFNDGEPVTPRNVSYGQGLLEQSKIAKDHVLNAFNAAAIGAFGEMRVHCEHVTNIIEGTAGPRFADYNGDGRAENPGDGFGTLTYARQVAALLPDAGDELSVVEDLLIAIQDKAQEILAAPDVATAQPALDEFKALGERLLDEDAPAFYTTAQAAISYPIAPTP